jgi:hypothetical protein
VVAVATGTSPRPELEVLGPDLMLDDLAGADEVLAWGRRVAAAD